MYKNHLSETEELSLSQCLKVLGTHRIVLVQPENLDTSDLLKRHPGLESERFPPEYFAGRDGYNKMMLAADFYARFLDVEYVLIHQLDAFVFRDELGEWCSRGYDYIGAPWLPPVRLVDRMGELLKSPAKRKRHARKYCAVGNGGFSLRKVRSFLNITKVHASDIRQHLSKEGHASAAYEDVFWGIVAGGLDPNFRVPSHLEALRFAIDHRPATALQLNGGKLPFGCHGFEKRRVKRFWKPLIDSAVSQHQP